MNDSQQQKLFRELEDLMELDEGSITATTGLAALDEWDSLAIVSTMAMIDEEFDVMLEAQKLSDVASVADLIALIEQSQA